MRPFMRILAFSIPMVLAFAQAPAMAAASLSGGGASGGGGAGVSNREVDDLLRRVERDLDRLTRGINEDIKHIERKTQPTPRFQPQPVKPEH